MEKHNIQEGIIKSKQKVLLGETAAHYLFVLCANKLLSHNLIRHKYQQQLKNYWDS